MGEPHPGQVAVGQRDLDHRPDRRPTSHPKARIRLGLNRWPLGRREVGSSEQRTEEWCTMRIGLTGIFVDDQDQAEQFYTEVLGLQVKTSAPYGPEERWLSVVSPRSPTGWSWCCTWPTSRRGRSRRPAARSAGRYCRCAATTVPPRPSGSRP